MNSIAAYGFKGLQSAFSKAESASQRITGAIASGDQAGVVGGALDLKSATRDAQASSKIIRVAETLDEAVLNILA